MLCARVVRGISSMEKEVTPVPAISWTISARSERAQEADENLVAAHEREVGFAGAVVRAVAENLRDDVGGGKDSRRGRARSSHLSR